MDCYDQSCFEFVIGLVPLIVMEMAKCISASLFLSQYLMIYRTKNNGKFAFINGFCKQINKEAISPKIVNKNNKYLACSVARKKREYLGIGQASKMLFGTLTYTVSKADTCMFMPLYTGNGFRLIRELLSIFFCTSDITTQWIFMKINYRKFDISKGLPFLSVRAVFFPL